VSGLAATSIDAPAEHHSRPWWSWPSVHVVLLLALYALVVGLGDTRAASGSDAGGKVATVKYMHDHHTLVPQVGYWAASADPSGTFHPLYHTYFRGDYWIQATSLPFVYAGLPLYDLAGTRGLLIIPILGSLLAALAARRLARRLGSRTGWAAFWLVGAASPMLFYAGDFWEHSAAVGLALLSLTLALEAPQAGGRKGLWTVAAAGLLAGLAAVLRTEVLVYAAAFGLGVILVRDRRRAWLHWPSGVGVAVAAFAAPLVANRLIERAILGVTVSGQRAGTQLSSGGGRLGERAHTALLTAVGLLASESRHDLIVGSVFAALLLVVGWRASRDRAESLSSKASAAAVAGLYVYRMTLGLGFVPGMLPATPLGAAASGGLRAPRGQSDRSVVVVTALFALPVIWFFQWQGQLLPQWAGRYELISGALLAVVGAVVLEQAGGWRRPLAALLVVSAVGITGFGEAWHIRRTRAFAHAVALIETAPPDVVVVSTVTHLAREGGAFYGDHRWLSAGTDTLGEAIAVAAKEGARRIDVVELAPQPSAPSLPDWIQAGTRHVPILGFDFLVWRYQRAGH
jgi:hypothetical protein